MKLFSFVVGCLLLAAAAVHAQGLSGGTYYNKNNGPFIDPPVVRAPDVNGAGNKALGEALKGNVLSSLAHNEGPSPAITGADYSLSRPMEFRLPCRYPRFIKEPARKFRSQELPDRLSDVNKMLSRSGSMSMGREPIMERETTMQKFTDRYGMSRRYCW